MLAQMDSTLEAEADQLLEREWRKVCRSHGRGRALASTDICPARWLMHHLLAVVAQSPDRPVRELSVIIRREIEEQNFVDECGDCTSDTVMVDAVDEEVLLLVRVLECVRRDALARGLWAADPKAAGWFG